MAWKPGQHDHEQNPGPGQPVQIPGHRCLHELHADALLAEGGGEAAIQEGKLAVWLASVLLHYILTHLRERQFGHLEGGMEADFRRGETWSLIMADLSNPIFRLPISWFLTFW